MNKFLFNYIGKNHPKYNGIICRGGYKCGTDAHLLDYMVSVEFPRKIYDEVSRVLTEYEHPEEVGLTSQEAADQIYFALVKLQNLMTDQI